MVKELHWEEIEDKYSKPERLLGLFSIEKKVYYHWILI